MALEFDDEGRPIFGDSQPTQPAISGLNFDDEGRPIFDTSAPAQAQPQAPTPGTSADWWGDYWGHLKDHASRAYNDSLDGRPVSMPETDPITAKDLLDKRTALQQQIFDGADPNTDGETRAQAKLAAQRLAKIDHVLGTMGTPTGELATGVQKPGDIIDALPHEKLMASDRYQQAYDAASPVLGADDAHAYAKNVVANDAHFIPYMSDSIFSDLMGAPKATAFDKNYNPPAPPTPQAELSAVEPGYASETAPDFGTGKVSKEELAAFGRTTAGRYGQIVAYDVLEGTEEFAKLPALTAAGVLSIFGDHAEAARDFLFKYGVKPQDDMVAMAEANKPLPVGIGEQAVDKVAKMIPGLVAMAATYNPEMLLTPATELFSMPLWRQVWQQAVETTVQQMPAGAVGSLPGAIERGQQIAEKGGSAAATALGTAEELATGTVQMSMPMARGGAWWEKAISGGSAFTAQDIAASAAAGQPITPASIIASMAVGAAMGQMHQEQQKILLPKFANAMSALEHDPENMSRLTWVAETMKDKGAAGGLWATAELHNITVKGETRDEAAYQEWKAAKAVTEPTAAEQAPGEGQTTLQAAEDLVGAPGQPLNVTPPPIGSPGALDTTAIHVLPPLPPDEHPGAQVPPAPEGEPIPATGLEAVAKERLQPPVAPVGAPAVRVTDVQATEAAHAQAEADRARQEAEIEHERQSGDVQTAASIAASEDAAREAAARGQGPPIPTTLAAAMETAKRVPPKPKPEPPKLTEGTVTGGEAPTPVREGEQTIEGHRPAPPTSPEFQLSGAAMAKGAEVPSKPSFRMDEPAAVAATRLYDGGLAKAIGDKNTGSEVVSNLFESHGDVAANLAEELGLDTVSDAQVSAARDNIRAQTQAAWADKPEMVTVYRGGPVRGEIIPVTTRKDVAKRHSELVSGKGQLQSWTIPKSEILADMDVVNGPSAGWRESELLVHRDSLNHEAKNEENIVQTIGEPVGESTQQRSTSVSPVGELQTKAGSTSPTGLEQRGSSEATVVSTQNRGEGEEPELKQALGAPAGDTGIPKDLPSAKTEQTDKLSAALNEHAPDPTGAKIDLEEIHRDHLPPEVQTAINEVEKFTGTQVHVIRDNTPGWEGRVRFNGAMYNGHLFVNESSQHPIVHTLAHEWTHQLKRTAPPLYQILENEIKRQGGVEAFGQSAVGRGYRPEKHAEELTADTNGDALGDRAFMERMAKENPTAFGKLASSFGKYLDTFLGKVSDYGTNRYVKDVDAYRQVLSAVMHTHAFDAGIKSGTMRRVGAPSLRKAPDDEEEQAVAAAAGKAERTTSPEQLGGFGRGGEVADNARYQGGARAGQYIGAPAKYNTPAKIGGLRRLFRQLTQEGESGRYWYRDSGAWILQHAGSVEEARKLAKVLAIYSPQAKVDANTTMALHAWEQYKAGQPINAKTGVQDAYASRVLYGDGVFEGGEKTNNFYNNLMRHVDPASHAKQGATIDLWMMRAAGYHTDSPTDAAYRFVENEVNRVAQEMGWSPEEVQAAIWVAMKARTENKGVKERTEAESTKKGYMRYDTNPKGEEVRNVLDEGKHRGVWLKHAMALDVSAEDTRAASYDFGNALNDRAAQLSHESIPSVESGVLPGIHDAPMEQKIEYHRAIQDALKNEDGRDAIDTEVGPFAGPGVEGFSGWEGKSTVGTQHAQPIYTKDGKVSENSRRLIELSQSIRGQLLNQKAMAWHYPIYDGSKYVQNGAEINLGRHLTEEENAAFYTALAKHLGHSEAPPIPTVDGQGVRVLNFPAIPKGLTQGKLVSVTRKANDDFHSAVQMAIHDQPWHNEVSDYTRFQSDGEYISSEAANGPANYRGRIEAASRAIEEARPRSWAGRSDIQDWIEKDLRPRVDAVNQDFAKRYGWDKGRAEGVTEAPELSLAAEENVPPHSDKTEDGEPVRTIKSSIGNLHIETDKGQTRTGTTEEGKPFSTVMKHPYGYVEGVPGRDGGSMDVLVAGEAGDPSRPVFVIHQKNAAGGFDEHKVVVGAKDQRDAERAYLSEYPKGWDRMGQVEQFTPAQFKEWARTTGREQAQVGKVDPAVPRANIRGQQPDAVAMHAVTDRALPERTANEHGRLDLPNAVKGIASRTQFTSAEGGGGKHETVLRNLYDAKADPRGLFDIARDNLDAHSLPVDLPHIMNEFERLVISHGFDGYKTPDGQATVLGAKVPTRAKTTEVGHGLATERTESGAGRITGVAGENAGRDNAPVREGETTARAAETKGDETTGEGTVKDEGVRVPDEQKGQASHQGLTAEHEATAIANAHTEAARLARGEEMIERIRGKTAEELHAAAHEELRKNPNRGLELAKEVAEKPRNISDVEAAILAVDRQRIIRSHDDATQRTAAAQDAGDKDAVVIHRAAMKFHEDHRELNEQAAVHAGTEWSKSGLARRLLINSDESFGGLLAAAKVKAGRDMTEKERGEIKADAEERAKLKDKLESPGLKEKPTDVRAAAQKKFADALAELKAMPKEKMMSKECWL